METVSACSIRRPKRSIPKTLFAAVYSGGTSVKTAAGLNVPRPPSGCRLGFQLGGGTDMSIEGRCGVNTHASFSLHPFTDKLHDIYPALSPHGMRHWATPVKMSNPPQYPKRIGRFSTESNEKNRWTMLF